MPRACLAALGGADAVVFGDRGTPSGGHRVPVLRGRCRTTSPPAALNACHERAPAARTGEDAERTVSLSYLPFRWWGASAVQLDAPPLELLDLGGGSVDEPVGQLGQRSRDRQLLTDLRPLRITRIPPSSPPSTELPIPDAQDRLGFGLEVVLSRNTSMVQTRLSPCLMTSASSSGPSPHNERATASASGRAWPGDRVLGPGGAVALASRVVTRQRVTKVPGDADAGPGH